MNSNNQARRSTTRSRTARNSPSASPVPKRTSKKLGVASKLCATTPRPVSFVPISQKIFTFRCEQKMSESTPRSPLKTFAYILDRPPSPLNRLPNEVLHIICRYLEPRDLRNLRWLRSQISAVALEYMSPSSLDVENHSKSLLRLFEISRHDSMRRSVTSVTFSFTDPGIYPRSYDCSVPATSRFTDRKVHSKFDSSPMSLQYHEELFIIRENLCEQAELLRTQTGIVMKICDALSCLPKLDTIQFRALRCHSPSGGLIRLIQHLIVQVLQDMLSFQHLKVHSLALNETPSGAIPALLCEPAKLALRMSTLRSLSLRWRQRQQLSRTPGYRWVRPTAGIDALSAFLQFLPRLTSLKLDFLKTRGSKTEDEKRIAIPNPLDSVILQELSLLELDTLWLIEAHLDANDVLDFVRKHQGTLKELLLIDYKLKHQPGLSCNRFLSDVRTISKLSMFRTQGLVMAPTNP